MLQDPGDVSRLNTSVARQSGDPGILGEGSGGV